MNTEKKIYLYLEGELSAEERKSFEQELENSPELQNDLNLYRKFVSAVNETKNISVESDYFSNIIPEFNRRFEGRKEKRIYPKIAYAFSALVILFLVYFVLFNTQNRQVIKSNQVLTENSSNTNSNGFFDITNFSVDELIPSNLTATDKEVYNSELNSILEKELNISSDSTKLLVADQLLDYNSIIDNISQKDADMVYNGLLNKKF